LVLLGKRYDAAVVNSKEAQLQNSFQRLIQLPPTVDGRIRFRLAELGLSRWGIPIQDWQQRFQGLEKWLSSASRQPTLTILGLLGSYGRSQTRVNDGVVANDLAHLEFTYWHARWPGWVTQGRPMRWQPLQSAFADFERRYSAGLVPQVWVSDKPTVAAAEASSHLLHLLSSSQTQA
jgi:hypothetical protein